MVVIPLGSSWRMYGCEGGAGVVEDRRTPKKGAPYALW